MKRFPLPDLLKGFAVFLIVPVHVLEKFIDYPGRESTFGKILLILGGPIAVPVFMMVLGYFVACSRKSLLMNLSRGIFIFLVGIFLNIGLNFHLLLKIYDDNWNLDPLQAIFSVDIFLSAGLSIIVLSALKVVKYGQLGVIVGLILFVSGTTFYFNEILMVTDRNYILPFIGGKYSWSYFPLFPWLTYPLIGFLIHKLEFDTREFIQRYKKISLVLLLVILTLVMVFSQFGLETTLNLPEYYHHGFSFVLWTLGVDILWMTALWYLILKFNDFFPIVFLRWLGQNITAIYVIQWLIIGNIATAIYQSQELTKFWYWSGSIFLLTLTITYLYQKAKVFFQHSNYKTIN
jgi:hypothetical protein